MQKQRLRIIVSLVVAIAAASLCGPPPSAGAAVVRTDKHLYNAGEPIVVQFSNAPGIDSDWICVVPVGAPDSERGDYQYLPAGVAPVIAPAAAYVWLLGQHHAATSDYPFRQLYTWAVDRYQGRANLVVGVFGQRDPLIVAPQVEGHGGGVGVWPLLVPRAVVPDLWPAAPAS